MDAQRELLELAKEMLGYSDLTPEQIEWAARIEALATTLAAREDGWVSCSERFPEKRQPIYGCNAAKQTYWEEIFDPSEPLGSMTHWHSTKNIHPLPPPPLPVAPPAQGTGEGDGS